MPEASDYIEVSEICELFHVTRNTVYRWATAGKIKPASRVGRKSYYRRAEIYALIDPETAKKSEGENA